MATIINAAHQFKTIFSTNGYFLIMPDLLRIYSNNQTNHLITTTVEYVCKQLYILHRKPFLLQMFGSVAPILDRFVSRGQGFPVLLSRNRNTETLGLSLVSEPDSESKFRS